MATMLLLGLPVLLVVGLVAFAFVLQRRRARAAHARTLVYRIRVTGQDEAKAAIALIVAAANDAQARLEAMPVPRLRVLVERETDDARATH